MAALRQTSGCRIVVTPDDIAREATRPPSQMNGARTIEASGPVIRAGAPKSVTSNEQNTIR